MNRMHAPALLALAVLSVPAQALAPGEIWIVANKNVADSKTIAEYYCLKRGVPKANIIYLDLTANEDISRASYDANVVKPLRTALATKKASVKLLLTVTGVPLRVGPTTPSAVELADAVKLQGQLDDAIKQRDALYAQITAKSPAAATNPEVAKEVAALKTQYNQIVAQIATMQTRMRYLKHVEAVAAFDSELATLWVNATEFRGYSPSALYWRNSPTL